MRRLRPLSFLLALATTLWTGGFSYLQFAPVAQAASDTGLKVLGSPESILESGLTGQAFKDAVDADRTKLRAGQVQADSVKGTDVTMAPSIAENTIALLPATMTAADSWNGATVERSDASGRRYVAWIDGREAATSGLSSVFFSRSTDGGATWSTPVRADNPAGGPAYVWLGLNMIADQQGNLVLVWDDYRNLPIGSGLAQVFYSRSTDAGQTWSTPAALTTDSRISLFAPYINGTLDTDGNLNVVWSDFRTGSALFGPSQIYSIHSSDWGATWGVNQIVDDSGGTGIDFAQHVALGRTGEVIVVWHSNRAGGSGEDLMLARSTNGGTSFAADTMINQYAAGTLNLDRVKVCSDGNGRLLAAWMADDPSASDDGTIYTRTSADFGATWSATSPVLTNNADLGDPLAAACSFGSTYMAVGWQDADNNALNVATSTDGGANWIFNGVERDVPLGCCDADELYVDVDSTGRVLAAWTDSRNGLNDVFVNYSLNGGTTWQTADFKATNQVPSGASAVTLSNTSFSLRNNSNAETNDRLTFNLTYYDPRASARGLYAGRVTFAGTSASMQRLSGSNRYKTGVAVAQNQFPTAGTVSGAVFATGENFPDGLSATSLAAMISGPVFLVKQGSLPSEVAAEFLREYDKKTDAGTDAYVVGGTSVISTSVENAIKALDPSINLKRLSGSNRKKTAVAVAQEEDVLRGHGPKQAVLANAGGFADALTGGAIAGNTGIQNDRMPVLLTDTGSLDADTKAYLASVAGTLSQLHIIGGTSAVSSAAATAADAVVATVVRHAGGNRYSTAVQAAKDFFQGTLTPQTFGLASGTNFPDALTGGLWAALHLSPLLLTDPSTLSSETATYLSDNAATINSGVAFGGTSALSQSVLDAAALRY